MRKEFASYLHKQMNKDSRIRLITADLGYGLWDRIKNRLSRSFLQCYVF